MKLRRIAVENVRSFLDRQELLLPKDTSILIGPNGGGKTNLLDIVLLTVRFYLLRSWVPIVKYREDMSLNREWAVNDSIKYGFLEKHRDGNDKPQVIELDIEVTETDISNMKAALEIASDKSTVWERPFVEAPGEVHHWDLDSFAPGQLICFRIVDGGFNLDPGSSEFTFSRYLDTHEIYSLLREERAGMPPSVPLMSLPVTRSGAGISSSVSLASFTDGDLKRAVDVGSSRSIGQITSLAIGRMATRYRNLLEMDTGDARKRFLQDPINVRFTEILKSLGYGWDLKCTNKLTNQYDVQLVKQGTTFSIAAASSGERELVLFVYAIYALNVRDALIIIDEPELHLHPTWQRALVNMFDQLSAETGNQFLIATHSPSFVLPTSIKYVSRVYTEKQKSRIVNLAEGCLPRGKHLFSMINSHNNERMFFADIVILVEGISDRIFFEAVFRFFEVGANSGKTMEIISVGGKTLFTQYESLLSQFNVPSITIGDLDYLSECGSSDVRRLFQVSVEKLRESISDPGSLDGKSLVARLDDAIGSSDMTDLRALWKYVKSRHTRLKKEMTQGERSIVEEFIFRKRNENCIILRQGSLEDYLPVGFRAKDIEKLISLVSDPEYWDKLPDEARKELSEIVEFVKMRFDSIC